MTTKQPTPSPRRSGTAQVLRIYNYRLAWPAGLSSQMGRMMWTFVCGYLVFKLSGSAFLTSMVAVTFAAPQFFLGVFSGTLADAYDRRVVMMISLLLMSAFTFLAAGLAFTRTATTTNILALSLITGLLFTLNQVTKRTFTFDVVGRDLLMGAMALDNMAMTAGTIMGPVLVGVLLDLAPDDPMRGAAWAFLAIAIFDALALVLLLFIRPNWVQAKISLRFSSVISSTTAGLKVVGGNRALVGIMGITVLFNFVFPPHRTMIPVFGETVLHIGPTALGFLGAAQGLGSLVGAAYLASRGIIKKQSLLYWGGACIAMGFLAVFAASTTYPMSFVGLALAGIGQSWFGSIQATLVLTSVEENMRGRVMGILSMAIGSQTLGSLLLGSLSDSIGPGPGLLIMAIGGTVATMAWAAAFKEMRKL